MKKSALKDNKTLASMDILALNKELKTMQEELYVLRMKKASNELKETHLLKEYKAQIARINTFLNQINL